MWNRFIDSTDDQEIVKIERRIFDSVVETVDKDQGEWIGSCEQKSSADHKVACTIKNSFKNYESRRKEYEKSYLKFK